MRKVCVVTGTRAEYGLLYWLLKAIQTDKQLQLQLVATGMHLSPEFGLTYQAIEKDGFVIDEKIEMLLSGDSSTAIAKSIGLGVIGFADAFSRLRPDVIVVLGDRFEIFAAAQAAMTANIPIAHIHGGETTEGLIDEAIRHSISKMSHLHFVATKTYRDRVIQLGEHPDTVFNFGSLGIENIKRLNLLSKQELEKSINFRLNKRNILITFHSVTLEDNTSYEQFSALLNAVDKLKDTHIIFTKTNSDAGGRVINDMINQYTIKNSHKAISFISLGQLRYLSVLQYMDSIVGNSSSGLLEAPSFKIGTLNIGDRQKGRIKADSIIECNPDEESIAGGFDKLYSKKFQALLGQVKNPYSGLDNVVSKKMVKVLRDAPLNGLKKTFFDT